jgi:integrator complex subunit 6
LETLSNELKNLQATGLSTLEVALKSAFDLLNVKRMETGIDMYGQGRHPFFLQPAVIVAITDGGKLAYSGGIHEEVCNSFSVYLHLILVLKLLLL